MLLYFILDLNKPAWFSADSEQDPLNNLQIFINAFVASDIGNRVKAINSRTVIFDSAVHSDVSPIFEYLNRRTVELEGGKNNQHSGDASEASGDSVYESLCITPQDVGYALMDEPDCIFLFNMSNENPRDYLNFLKCMFTAQSRKVPIHGFSPRGGSCIKMCCEGSGGRFLTSCSLRDLLGLFGNPGPRKESYEAQCTCCHKSISLGLVCPICLSVYCKFLPVCKICRSKFSFAR